MATTLFLLNAVPDIHLGANNAKRDATAAGWVSRALGTSRGASYQSATSSTVAGATNGVEVGQLSHSFPLEWISPPVAADVTISGTITANLWAAESNMSANVAINVIIDILRANTTTSANSNTIQNIVQSTRVTEVAVTTADLHNFTTGMTSGGYTGQTLNRGDRLRIRVVGDDVGTMASGYTFTINFNFGTASVDGDSYVTFTENITFESGAASDATVNNFPASTGFHPSHGATGGFQEAAQSFLSPGTGTLREVRATHQKSGAPTDNLIWEIQSDSGSNAPSGTSLGTIATVAGTSLTTAMVQYAYTCSISLSAGVKYWIVARRDGGVRSTVNTYWWANAAENYADGTSSINGSGTWVVNAADLLFGVTVSVPGSTVYLTDTASAVSTASQDLEAWTSRGSGVVTSVTNTAAGWTAPLQATTTAGGTVIDWFTKPLTAFTLTGMAVANIRALESNASANASLRCEIARVEGDGTSPTVWCSWCCAPTGTDNGELTTSEVARTINLSGDDLAITNGQRLRIRLYNDDISSAAMAATYTVTRYYAGTSGGASGDTYITFPQTLTEYSSGPFTYTKAGYGKEAG